MNKLKYLGISLLFLQGYTATLRADSEPIISGIVVFGESSSDTGNVFHLTCDDAMVIDPPCFFGLYYE